MAFNRSLVEGPYLRDILAQPAALEDTVAGLCATGLPENMGAFDRIVLTGMGASFHALEPLVIRLVDHGFAATAYETSELLYYYPAALTDRTLLVVVSQSGRSVEIVRLMEGAAARVRTIAVTNTPDSPLAARANITVLTRAGEESTVSCKTYVSTLAALEWLAAALTGEHRRGIEQTLRNAAPAVASYLDGWENKVAALMDRLAGVRDLFVIGRGASLAAARNGGLILKESAHFHAEGMSCSAFRHGPFEMSGPSVYVTVFAGDARTRALNEKLVADIRQTGAGAGLIGPESDVEAFQIPDAAPEIRSILEMLPLQLVSLAVAALAGHVPGKFSLLTKVTTIE